MKFLFSFQVFTSNHDHTSFLQLLFHLHHGNVSKGSRDLYCTSSLAIRMLSVTSENTVGFINRPLSSMARPPHSSFAPSFFPLSISSRILSNWFWSICQTKRKKTSVSYYCSSRDCDLLLPGCMSRDIFAGHR